MQMCDSGHVPIAYESDSKWGEYTCPLCTEISNKEDVEGDLEHAETVLEETHTELEEVKDRLNGEITELTDKIKDLEKEIEEVTSD